MYITTSTDRQRAKLDILEKRLSMTHEKIRDKYNARYFALKALIAKEKIKLSAMVQHDYLAQ